MNQSLSKDWKKDSVRFFGHVLTGKYAHWCADWDYLPIDETCDEFKCCTCSFPAEEKQ